MNKKIKSLIVFTLTLIMIFSASLYVFAETSFSYRFDDKHEKLLSDYPDFSAIVDENLSTIPMPGVEQTKMGDGVYCYNMVPQGFCFAGDYILITAYDYAKEFNSVIYVISNDDTNNRELLSVLILDDKNHVGGIASDGEYVFIARSTDEEIGVIELSAIAEASLSDVAEIDYLIKVPCGVTASCVSYFDGKLWINEFNDKFFNMAYGFELKENNGEFELVKTNTLWLPAKTQGYTFFEENGETYLVASCSYGRNNIADLVIYKVTEDGNKLSLTFANQFRMPPLTEEIDVSDGHLYLISEGAATEYTSTDCRNTDAPLDRVAVFELSKLITAESNCSIIYKFVSYLSSILNNITQVFVR